MKKFCSILFSLIFLSMAVFAQNASDDAEQKNQFLIPKDVYIGDSAQIHYSFRSAVDLFAFASPDFIENNQLHLNTSIEVFSSLQNKVTVQNAVLERNGLLYSLVITIIPWKSGVIDFESFNLIDAIPGAEEKNGYHLNYQIKLNSINVASIADKMNVTQLRPPYAPLYLPGTNYVVWAMVVGSVLILMLIIFIVVKFPKVVKSINGMKKSFGNFQNSFTTKRHLKKLLKEEKTDKEFASSWQSNMKNYLDYRFETSFASVPGSKIGQKIKEVTGGECGGLEEDAIDKLSAIFIRSDYIRYAQGSVATSESAETDATKFGKTERQEIVDDSFSCMKIFDQKETKEDD